MSKKKPAARPPVDTGVQRPSAAGGAKQSRSERGQARHSGQKMTVPATPADKGLPGALIAIAAIVLMIVSLLFFGGLYKIFTLAAGILLLVLFIRRGIQWREVLTPQTIALFIYLIICGLSGIWALSGKFFLQEFSKLLFAGAIYLLVATRLRYTARAVYRMVLVFAGCSALYTLISVEAASTGLVARVLALLPGYEGISIGFEAGTRLTGIFGNPNVLAGILALGTLLALYLVSDTERAAGRFLPSAILALNAFGLLLVFSMGGTAMFLLAILAYLAFAGKARAAALVHMLAAAIPTVIFAFVAFPFFNQSGVSRLIPLLAMAGDVAAVYLLERFVTGRVALALEKHGKAAVIVIVAACVCVLAYAAAALSITGAYTFGSDVLRRSAYPEPGAHILTVEADGPVQVTVVTQNMSQIMMHTETTIYSGEAANAQFTVPEDSEVVYFNFSAQPGTTLSTASLDGTEELPLNYPLLPGFIANRLQGLWANQNAIQRIVFFEDGMKLFAQSPVIGNGMGSFENAIMGIQRFYYETKYVHNNYIQVLLDTGVVGFVAYISIFVLAAWSLLRRLRIPADRETEPYRAIYPALWGGLVMILGHSAVEVTMSNSPSLLFAFLLLALIAACYGQPIKRFASDRPQQVMRWACCGLSGVFSILLCGNLTAWCIASQPVSSTSSFFSNMELASTLDVFERNDYKLSYVVNALNSGTQANLNKANQYAAELAQVNSNSIPPVLVSFYLSTGQYSEALSVARTGLAYTASSSDQWNQILGLFRQAFVPNLQAGVNTPFADEATSLLLRAGLQEIYNDLVAHNQASMEDIALTAENLVFLGQVRQITAANGDLAIVLPVLTGGLFDSAYAADTNADGMPDLVSDLNGVTWSGESAQVEAGGTFVLTLPATQQDLQLTIRCADPGSIAVTLNGETLIPTVSADTGTVQFPAFTEAGADSADCVIQISSASAQQLESVAVSLPG